MSPTDHDDGDEEPETSGGARSDAPVPADLVVEPATSDDLETLADDWVALAREQAEYGSHVLPESNRETIRDVLSAHQFDDGVLVARLDGDVVGFASFSLERGMFSLDATRGLLSNLYVRPADRNRGVGTALLEAVEDALGERGAEVVLLEAMADNAAARRFYRRNGYEPTRVTMERRIAEREREREGERERGRGENDTHSKEER